MVRLAALCNRVNWGDVPPELAVTDDVPVATDLRFEE
jgi:hypothetical protein